VKTVSYKDPVSLEVIKSCLAASEGDVAETKRMMNEAGYDASEKVIANKGLSAATDIAEIREKLAPRIERQMTGDMLDSSVKTLVVLDMAVEQAKERLENERVVDPAKMARDLAQVIAQMSDKRLALEGRPTSITETRSPDEIVRALEGMGVARQTVIESTAIEEDA
jgi:hypothetical protein